MGRRFLLWPVVMSLAFGLLLSASAPVSAYQRSSLRVDVGFFYNDLEPYGDWVETEDYGHCWTPSIRSTSWRPYQRGHWVWTDDYAWFWASDEPFGWATYHYGRWVLDPYYGWVWVPGYEWAPAWVSWRSGGGYVGWAPLPPRVSWSAGFGFRVGGAQIDTYISPRAYSFVEERAFVDRAVYRRMLPAERNNVIIRETENVTDYRAVGDRIMAHGPRLDRIERVAGHRVPRERVVDVNSVQEVRRGQHRRDAVAVFRPHVEQSNAVPPHPRAERRGLREHQARESEQQTEIRRQDRGRRQELEQRHQAEQRQAERQRRLEQQERQNIEKRQARQRDEMEQRHRQEMRKRQDFGEIERGQREEHRAMQEQQRRERQQQFEQAQQQRQAAREERGRQEQAAREQAQQERRAAREERAQQADRQAERRAEGRQEQPQKKRNKEKGNDRPE